MLPLTKRQKEILDYIDMSTNLNGYAPSLQEIRDHFNLKAISTVHEHLENLKVKGYIKKEMNQARGIQLCKENKLPDYMTVKVKGKIEGESYTGKLSQTKNIIVDNTFLKEGKTFFAFEIGDKSLNKLGYFEGDFIIISETKDIKEDDMCIQKQEKNMQVVKFGSRNKLILGKIVCLIRTAK